MKRSLSILIAVVSLAATYVTATAQSSHLLSAPAYRFSFSVPLSLAVRNSSKDMQGNPVTVNLTDTMLVSDSAVFNPSDSAYRSSVTPTSISVSTQMGVRTWSLSIVLDTAHGVAQVSYSDINGAPAATTSWSDYEVSFRNMPYHLANGVVILMPGISDSLRAQISGSYIRRDYSASLDHTERSIPLSLAPGTISISTTGSLPSGVRGASRGNSDLTAMLSGDGKCVIIHAVANCEIVSIGGQILWRSANSSSAQDYRVPVSQIGAGAVIVHAGRSSLKLFIP